MKNNIPIILIILDGWGIAKASSGNAITTARTPFFDYLKKTYPSTSIYAHGKYVGLPNKQDGNSEAGHLNIGAGRIVEQEAVRINSAIKKGLFYKNLAFLSAIHHAKKNKSNIHLMGLVSGVMSPHSLPDHLKALIELMKREKFNNYFLHLFTDGRDSSQRSALKYITSIQRDILGGEKKISTIMGRYFGMDRKKNWANTELAYDALVSGTGKTAISPQAAITQSYNTGLTDEFIEPFVMTANKKQLPRISDNNAIIFFNLRSDRARQLTKCFVQKEFEKQNPNSFKRKKVLKNIKFITMTDFGPDLDSIKTAFPGVELINTLPKAMEDHTQLYVAETEKYAHVTYFFNGGYSKPLNGEKWKVISSPNCKYYDEAPGMKSTELTELVINNLRHHSFKLTPIQKDGRIWHNDFTVLNLAAPDMIAHTGNLKAGIQCCEITDSCLKQITKAYLQMKGTIIITADHGNIEEMINLKTDEIDTKHSTNKVPFIIINKNLGNKIKLRSDGKLCDIAPTILHLTNTPKPKEMTGRSMIIK
ncbi:2,3-bisphosphoglycerate-independent phosphoglycerate mutase [Patescibacteria group bacterium]|nr:2,3-bisphosphoglycerate-independent phosphoglycerate mutase [Patescibacteria group bacterium]